MWLNTICNLVFLDQLALQPAAKKLMEDAVLSFSICAVVIIDSDGKFHWISEGALQALQITVYQFEKLNHKKIIAEKYGSVLNKTQAILYQDRRTYISILQNIRTP